MGKADTVTRIDLGIVKNIRALPATDAASTQSFLTGVNEMSSLDKIWFGGAVEKFFGSPAFKLHRKDSPSTSVQAAHKVDTPSLEKMVYEAIKSFGEHGCISDQILEMFPQMPYSSITARYKALLSKGYIEITGTRVGRSGRQQRVMVAR